MHEPVSAAYPLALTTGRLRDQWHGMSRTGQVARLFSHVEEPLLAMDAADLARRGLAPGDLAEVSSRRGGFVVRVEAGDSVRIGQAFMPMHWGTQFMRGGGVNALTSPAIDPYSKQPELKAAAIEVKRRPCCRITWWRCAAIPYGAGAAAAARPPDRGP